jgi:pyruvate dehydrogenase E1 component beta subunit
VLEPRSELARRAEEAPCDGSLRVLRDGAHATIATWGGGVRASLAAAEALAADGISARVVDLVSLAPLDAVFGDHVRATGRLVAAHDSDSLLARRVLRTALDDAFLYLESPPGDCPAFPDAVEKAVRDSVFY